MAGGPRNRLGHLPTGGTNVQDREEAHFQYRTVHLAGRGIAMGLQLTIASLGPLIRLETGSDGCPEQDLFSRRGPSRIC